MNNTLQRHLLMLQAIPVSPVKATTAQIKRQLEEYEISTRTIERDLKKLAESNAFPIERDVRSKPYGWSWSRSSKPVSLPGLDNLTALSYVLIEQHIKGILPYSITDRIQPYFDQAKGVLYGKGNQNKLSAWPNKIRMIDSGLKLKIPDVDAGVQESAHSALIQNKMLSVKYVAVSKTEALRSEINPLALVFIGGVGYLICTYRGAEKVHQLALHRFSEAHVIDRKVRKPKGFNLDEFIVKGGVGRPRGNKAVKVTFLIDNFLNRHLSERPLADDQKIQSLGSGAHKLVATVPDTEELRWWILSFGSAIEVEKPIALRKDIKSRVDAMHKRYQD